MTKVIAFFTAVVMMFGNLFLWIFDLPKNPTFEIDMTKFDETPIFADEFDGTELDKTIWTEHYAANGIRRGSYWDTDMATVADGALTIKTQYLAEGLNGKGAGWYTAGLDTHASFNGTYGYYECRCILPVGYGHWSAFWLHTSDMNKVDGTGKDGAEIDVMESAYWGNEKYKNSTIHTIHYDGYADAHRSKNDGHWKIPGDPYSEYHTYGVEWNEDGYTFYIDGKMTSHTKFGGASQVPEYMLLTVEVSGENGIPQAGTFSTGSIEDNEGGRDFTSEFIVDYVRVYQYK